MEVDDILGGVDGKRVGLGLKSLDDEDGERMGLGFK